MLIPVALPDKLRYRFLHNHVNLVLTRELRYPAGTSSSPTSRCRCTSTAVPRR